MTYVTTWMNLKNIILSEKSLIKKRPYSECPEEEMYRDRKWINGCLEMVVGEESACKRGWKILSEIIKVFQI